MTTQRFFALFLASAPLATGATGAQEAGPAGLPASFHWGDFDGDSLPDALVVDPGGRARLLQNRGDGTLEDVSSLAGLPQELNARFALWHDIDGDGDLDLFLGTPSGPSRVFRNEGSGTFSDGDVGFIHAGEDLHAGFLDYDQDGRPDLHVRTRQRDVLYHNLGAGRFEPVETGSSAIAAAPLTNARAAVETELESEVGVSVAANRDAAPSRAPGTDRESAARTASLRTGEPETPKALGTSVEPLRLGPLCARSLEDKGNGGCLSASSTPTLGMLFPLTDNLFVAPSGNVGIGTLTPSERLEIDGNLQFTDDLDGIRFANPDSTNVPMITMFQSGFVNGDRMVVAHSDAFSTWGLQYRDSDDVFEFLANGVPAMSIDLFAGLTTTPNLSVTNDTTLAGNVDAQSDLSVAGTLTTTDIDANAQIDATNVGSGISGATVRATNLTSGSGIALFGRTYGSDATLVLEQNGSGALVRAFDGGASPVFEVRNSGRCVTTALQITGGGDLVEGFESTAACPPGTVVVIDETRPGELLPSRGSYDRAVAGIVSGANGVNHGIRMGQDDVLDGDVLVAMSGRVYVRASAENGAIRPGDLLTTATVAGHAMKATDSARSFGAVIGKAMSSLDEDTGLVLVLVSLQ